MPIVHYKTYGEAHLPPLYIAHGVFGMLDNWHLIAQSLSEHYHVVTFDARNHGKSFHHPDASYAAMANDIQNLMQELGHDKIILVGHSMGGKTAMKFVDTHPDSVSQLVVVDIAPKTYKASHLSFINAFKEIPFDRILNRREADLAFSAYTQDVGIRQFLLKNIESQPDGGYQLKINIEAIESYYTEIIGEIQFSHPHNLPCTFIAGAKSNYISASDFLNIQQIFTQAQFISIPDAGHWVHAEQPQAFLKAIKECLIH
jgi:esterase